MGVNFPMGDQWALIVGSRLRKLNEVAAPIVAEVVREEMLTNTAEGHGFSNDEYYEEYTPKYAQRRKQGRLKPVTLRDRDLSLETANVVYDGRGGLISFISKGDIFRYHHDGTAKGGRMRSIFPKRVSSVPKIVKRTALREGRRALSGQQ